MYCRCDCGQRFHSLGAFEKHRVGTFAVRGQLRGTRRCLAPAEMAAIGLYTDRHGRWTSEKVQAHQPAQQSA